MDCIYKSIDGRSGCKGLHCDNPNCLIKFKTDYLYKEAGLSDNLKKPIELLIDEDGTDESEFIRLSEIQKDIVNFVLSGKNLFIHSYRPGNGKTSWCLRLLQTYFLRISVGTPLTCRGLFINVPHFLQQLKDNITDPSSEVSELKKKINSADLVIWDDIGTKGSASAFDMETLLSMIDGRIYAGKSNIFTSNLLDEDMSGCLGDRLASRICNLSENIVFNGGDKRGMYK